MSSEAQVLRAQSLFKLGDIPGAEKLLLEVARLDPHSGPAHYGLGEIYYSQSRWGDAALYLEKALALGGPPNLGHLTGISWNRAGRPERASPAYLSALEAKGRPNVWLETWLFITWYNPGFGPEFVLKESVLRAREMYPFDPLPDEGSWQSPDPHRPLHIGYVSADFRAHAMRRWIEPLLLLDDPKAFKITLFSNNHRVDEETARFRSFGHNWVDISQDDDLEAVRKIRALEVDILVDLSGYTIWNRMGVFAYRGAPVQTSMLGMRATTGLATMDYRWADTISHPEGVSDAWFTEALVRTGSCRYAFQPPHLDLEVSSQPCLGGRPFTFACLNNQATVNPGMMRLFACILRAVPGSRLKLLLGSPLDQEGKRYRADALAEEGVDPSRLDYFYRGDQVKFLGQYNQIDLILGTSPFQGSTSICESLWMGVPMLCLETQNQFCRSNRYILQQLGMEQWVGAGEVEYIGKAVAAACNPEALAAERKTLRQRLLESPLCDLPARARDREAFYRELWHRNCRRRGTLD